MLISVLDIFLIYNLQESATLLSKTFQYSTLLLPLLCKMPHQLCVVLDSLYLIVEKLQVPGVDSCNMFFNSSSVNGSFKLAARFSNLVFESSISSQPSLWVHSKNRFECTFVHFALFDSKNHLKIQNLWKPLCSLLIQFWNKMIHQSLSNNCI